MGKAIYHKATVTLKLPFEIAPDAELTALRAAGIPVDDLGVATSGFLHMRTTSDYRSHIFRWFASRGPADGLGCFGAPHVRRALGAMRAPAACRARTSIIDDDPRSASKTSHGRACRTWLDAGGAKCARARW